YGEARSGFVLNNRQVYGLVSMLGGAHAKHVPQWIKDADADVIQAFLDEAVSGDGWRCKGAETYSTGSPRLAGDIHERDREGGSGTSYYVRPRVPVLIAGREGHGTADVYFVHRARRQWAGLRNKHRQPNFSRVYHNGMVYCATVPNGTLIVRRNGKVAICGN